MGHIHAGVGLSHHRNPKEAVKEAVEQAKTQAGIEAADFCLIYSTVGYDQQALIDAVGKQLGPTPFCGCSGEGVIANGIADESNFSIGVMLVRSERLKFHAGLVENSRDNPCQAGQIIGATIRGLRAAKPQAVLLFPDGICTNYDALSSGILKGLGPGLELPFFGGAAGDNWRFKKTYQYGNRKVTSGGIAWALICGDLHLSWGVGHGCFPVGIEHRVTKAETNTIYEIISCLITVITDS